MSNPTDILLDFGTPFDQAKVQLLDQVVTAMYSNNAQDMNRANQILNQFKSNSQAWLTVDKILVQSSNTMCKFLALQILDEAVQTRWQILDGSDKNAIRSCLVSMVLEFPDQQASEQQFLLTKLNATLIGIVKFEWRTSWQNFIPEICEHAKVSETKCENALNILRIMSEEIFDFSKNQILQSEAAHLKSQMTEQFGKVNELCYWVLNQALQAQVAPSLVKSCLKTLQAFLSWIPLNYIFSSDLIENLITHFIVPIHSRNEAIKCFTEISSLTFAELDPNDAQQCKVRLCYYYCSFIQKITELTKGRSLADEYASVKKSQQQQGFENFARQLALAISAVIKNNIDLIEKSANVMEANPDVDMLRSSLQYGLMYMVQLTSIQEEELFKICLEFWHWFSNDVMMKTRGQQFFQGQEMPQIPGMDFAFAAANQSGLQASQSFLHQQVYPSIFREARILMFDHMAKPTEVLLTIGEDGDVEEEHIEDTEIIFLYDRMRETLIYMTHIDTLAMNQLIQSRLEAIKKPQVFTMDRLNKLCWALGSISGCMNEEEETKFVVSVIKELLNLCEFAKGKSKKAQIATDIMYVVGSFPNFLCAHWPFLKTVINKLKEFMREKHPGVKDMASETFLKLSKLTKHMFVQQQEKEKEPFLCVLIRDLPNSLEDLENHQQLMIYEGLGYMVSVVQDFYFKEQQLISLMQYSNQELQQILKIANTSMDTLWVPATIKQIDFIVKINTRVADSVGAAYFNYLKLIFEDIIKIYNVYSNCISTSVAQPGQYHDKIIKPMKAVRINILRLIQTYVNKEVDFTGFGQVMLPTLQALVNDYQHAHHEARNPEVLGLFSTLFKKMGEQLQEFLKQVVFSLCESTLEMIKNDTSSYPDFRQNFFKLIQNLIKHCTRGCFQLDSPQFHTLIMTVLFSMSHVKPELMEIGNESMHALCTLIAHEPFYATQFYKSFYSQILRDTLSVMTDYQHVSGFKLQCQIFQALIQAVDRQDVIDPNERLLDGEKFQPHEMDSNKSFVQNQILTQLLTMFPNLNKVQVEGFVLKLFNTCQEWAEFKSTVRDLLVSMKQFASANDAFYQDERDQQVALEQQRRQAIPGLMAPGQPQ